MIRWLVLACAVSTSLGWWCTAHMTIALIAQRELEGTPVWDKVNEILNPLFGDLTHNIANSFVETACWADDLQEWGLFFAYPWHFIDQPYNTVGFLNATASGPNVLWAIDQAIETLTFEPPSPAVLEKSMMMRFLIHFMGDMHQPLHVTSMWSRDFPHGDYGGNLLKIKWDDNIVELHAFWDAGVGYLEWDVPRPLDAKGWGQIATYADWATSNYTRADLEDLLQVTDRTYWAEFNFLTAVNYCYNGIQQYQVPTQDYVERAWPIVMRQIALAGYRLADALKSIYGTNNI